MKGEKDGKVKNCEGEERGKEGQICKELWGQRREDNMYMSVWVGEGDKNEEGEDV